jgi:hypothetical protein
MRPTPSQFARFLVVGVGNTVVSFVAYRLLLAVGTPYAVAAPLAFAVGTLNGYVFNRRWTFAARDTTRARVLGHFSRITSERSPVGIQPGRLTGYNHPSTRRISEIDATTPADPAGQAAAQCLRKSARFASGEGVHACRERMARHVVGPLRSNTGRSSLATTVLSSRRPASASNRGSRSPSQALNGTPGGRVRAGLAVCSAA